MVVISDDCAVILDVPRRALFNGSLNERKQGGFPCCLLSSTAVNLAKMNWFYTYRNFILGTPLLCLDSLEVDNLTMWLQDFAWP